MRECILGRSVRDENVLSWGKNCEDGSVVGHLLAHVCDRTSADGVAIFDTSGGGVASVTLRRQRRYLM